MTLRGAAIRHRCCLPGVAPLGWSLAARVPDDIWFDDRLGHAVMSSSRRIEELRAEPRYARERVDLYRAKMYGLRPTSMTQLRELERTCEGA